MIHQIIHIYRLRYINRFLLYALMKHFRCPEAIRLFLCFPLSGWHIDLRHSIRKEVLLQLLNIVICLLFLSLCILMASQLPWMTQIGPQHMMFRPPVCISLLPCIHINTCCFYVIEINSDIRQLWSFLLPQIHVVKQLMRRFLAWEEIFILGSWIASVPFPSS